MMRRREFLAAAGATPLGFYVTRMEWRAPDIIDVRNFGARGDSLTDDTDAFARAMDALPVAGGTVRVPAGNYMIDASRGVNLRSNIRFEIVAGARLSALPTTLGRYAIIQISDCENVVVTGGEVYGERHRHLGTGGAHGMGVNIRGARNVEIAGVTVADCWGDGFYVGKGRSYGESRDIRIIGCTARGNRRLGVAVTGCVGGLIEDGMFAGMGGNPPQSGINLECNEGTEVSGIVLRRNEVADNAGDGINVNGAKGVARGIRIEANRALRNGRSGIALKGGASGCTVIDNLCEDTRRNGILVTDGAHDNLIVGNTCAASSQGASGDFDNIRLQDRASANRIVRNVLLSGIHQAKPGYGISVGRGARDNRLESNVIESGVAGIVRDQGIRTTIVQ